MEELSKKDKTIHDQFSRYGRNVREWMNKCVLMLPAIEKNRIWEKKGFSSIYEYAAKIAGMSRHKVDDSLRIIRKLSDKPELMRVAKTKGLNAVRPTATIATKETDDFWAEKANKMSKSTLATFVRDYKNEQTSYTRKSRPGTGSPNENGWGKPIPIEEKVQLSMKLDRETAEALKGIKGDGDWNDVINKLLKFSRKALEAEEKQFQDGLEKEKPEKVINCTRYTPVQITKFVKKRSKNKCEHPNCNKSAKHIHHISPFALKKEHNPDKLLHLCGEHHRIIHLGYINDDEIAEKFAQSTAKQVVAKQMVAKQMTAKSENEPWKQVEKLPWYDIKNLINSNVIKRSTYG